MIYQIYLTDTQTGQSKVHLKDWKEDEDLLLFQWLENNNSCDCNRLPIFGIKKDSDICSEGRIRLDKIVEQGTGRLVWPEREG